MNTPLLKVTLPTCVLSVLVFGFSRQPAAAQSEASPDPEEAGVEHLLRGPVHEAFALPVNYDSQRMLADTKQVSWREYRRDLTSL